MVEVTQMFLQCIPTSFGDIVIQSANSYSRFTSGTGTSTTAEKCVKLTHCFLLNRVLPCENMLLSIEMQLQTLNRQKCINLLRHQIQHKFLSHAYNCSLYSQQAYLLLGIISKLLVLTCCHGVKTAIAHFIGTPCFWHIFLTECFFLRYDVYANYLLGCMVLFYHTYVQHKYL